MSHALTRGIAATALLFSIAACNEPQGTSQPQVPEHDVAEPSENETSEPVQSSLNQQEIAPEVLAEDRSALGARRVLAQYGILLEQRRFGEAWRLWSSGGEASGQTEKAFASSFDGYREIHAEAGMPGPMEGAAGSSYVDIPFRLYGLTKGGEDFNQAGTMTLRRANDVPGSTEEQRRWHIFRWEVQPAT